MEDILRSLVRQLLELMVLTGCFTPICVLQEVLGNHCVVLPVDDNSLKADSVSVGSFVAPDVDELIVVCVLDASNCRESPLGLPGILVHVRHRHGREVKLIVVV